MPKNSKLLLGLDKSNIIEQGPTGDGEAESNMHSESAPIESERRTTRQTIHGRQDALYSSKYHPMDDSVRLSSGTNYHPHTLSRIEEVDEEDEDEDEAMSDMGSEPEDDHEDRPAKRQFRGRTRHSSRHATPRDVNYNMQYHPQDEILREIDQDSSDEIELARSLPPATHSPIHIVPNSTSSMELFAEDDTLDDGASAPYRDINKRPMAPVQLYLQPEDFELDDETQVPDNDPYSVIDEIFSDNRKHNEAEKKGKRSIASTKETGESSTDCPHKERGRLPIPQASLSSRVSAGPPGRIFSRARTRRRASATPFRIYEDPEEREISIAERIVTALMAREYDPPKENFDPDPVDIRPLHPPQLPGTRARESTPVPVVGLSPDPRSPFGDLTDAEFNDTVAPWDDGRSWRFSPEPNSQASPPRPSLRVDLPEIGNRPQLPPLPSTPPHHSTTDLTPPALATTFRVVDDPPGPAYLGTPAQRADYIESNAIRLGMLPSRSPNINHAALVVPSETLNFPQLSSAPLMESDPDYPYDSEQHSFSVTLSTPVEEAVTTALEDDGEPLFFS